MAQDIVCKDFIINHLTQEQFNSLTEIKEDEVYVLTDAEGTYTKSESDKKYATKKELEGKQDKGDYITTDTFNEGLDTRVKIEQGTNNNNKILVVGSDGNVTLSNNTLGDYTTNEGLSGHTEDYNNPHNVTKTQVGLGNVDNTSDINKPVSTATQTALDLKADKSTTYTKDETDSLLNAKLDVDTAKSTYETIANFTDHKNNKSNPHSVTKEQVGLGNVNNTSDIDKPVSTATQTALDLKADKSDTYTKSETYNQEAIDSKLDKKLDTETASSTYATISNLNSHTSSESNPHKVTKEQVGLGNVDNTSDNDKPISAATQTALNDKANTSYVNDELKKKQDNLVSGTNIKTINNESLLGSTDIQLQTKLSGTNGNVVIYTDTTGSLSELGFDTVPTDNSDNLLKSGVVYDELAKKISYTDIVNDVTSGGTNKPLSAEQGKELSNRINLVAQSTHDRGVVLNALNSQGQNYSVTSILVNSGGSGYTLGDALFLISEELKIDSIITVDEVDALGTIKAVSLSKGGSFVKDPTGSAVSFIGGTGTDATFNITAMLTDNLTLNDIANPTPNDFATVLQDELHDNLIYIWKYADFNGDGVFNWVSGYPVQTEDRDFNIEPITNSELASNSVSMVKILDKNVTLDKLADDSVNADKIVEGSINNTHIADDANIAQSKINGLTNDLSLKADKSTTYTKTEVDEYINAKQNTITGAATTVLTDNLTTNRVVISNVNGKLGASSITTTELGYLSGVTSNIQTQLDSKANSSTTLAGYGITNAYTKDEVDQAIEDKVPDFEGAVSNIIEANLEASRVVVSDANGKISNSEITTTELNYLDGVTSNIQTQLDGKANNATTLAGYGITNAYTKDEADTLLNKKLDSDTASSTYETITNVNTHKTDYNNPHKVTKEQVGLGNVNNTSDIDKPVSTATQTALDLKADKSTTYTKNDTDTLLNKKLDSDTASSTYETIANVNAHKNNTSNPHSVTKEQVGLGNVDNTSDLDKPISTATQTSLDSKINIYQGADNADKPLIVGSDGNVKLGDTLVQPTIIRRWL